MQKTTQRHSKLTNQSGFTLVELMIAIVLALLLTAVAGQSYLSTKTTYRATEQNGRIQENLRFATHFINKQVRQSGNYGCFQTITSHLDNNANTDALYDLAQPINVWRWNSGNNFDLSSGEAYSTPDNGWQDAAGNDFPANAAFIGEVMAGNDAILINKLSEPLNIRLDDDNSITNNTLTIENLNGNTIQDGQLVVVGDCNNAEFFVHTGGDQGGGGAGGGSLVRGDGNNGVDNRAPASAKIWQKAWGGTAEVRLLESTMYFIGQGASGLPALFRSNLSRGFGVASANPIEIVDGVESMRALVGADKDDDRRVDTFLNVNQLATVPNAEINSLQIGLLAAGDQNSQIDGANARNFQLTQRHQVTSPNTVPDGLGLVDGAEDTRYRQATTTTVNLRNAGVNRPTRFFSTP